jgi:hypothetical protein
MEQKSNHHTTRILRAAAGLLCLTLFSSWVLSGLLARYVTSAADGDSASVAAFVFDMKDSAQTQSFDLSGITKPGDSASYTFTVSQKNGQAVSEVAMDYRFALALNGSMPLKCSIKKAESGTAELLTAAITDSTAAQPVTASTIQAQKFTDETETYTLTATWPDTANDAKYASRSASAEVILTVTAEQAD